ncbi:hypothetical protein GCM10025792_40760 [Pseudonocardia tropica]
MELSVVEASREERVFLGAQVRSAAVRGWVRRTPAAASSRSAPGPAGGKG